MITTGHEIKEPPVMRGRSVMVQVSASVGVGHLFGTLAFSIHLLTAATSAVLRLENLLGNGLFVNVILEPASPGASGSFREPGRATGRADG